ncbi:MAG: hypothetical protein KJ597_04925 [Nanoarchaeota archaeon]|nr:hypothetical protein [Nanoarchaeota archaeon]MBU1622888.1 hypothetical protein [Nanoarchaeota archaeon]
MNKKASLNLSIQAIVIVVIAFVVLGLGLGFVKGTFKDITSTTKDVQSKIKEQILEDMRTSGKKLSASQEVHLERGEETTENIGIVNTGTSTGKFGVYMEVIKQQTPDGDTITDQDLIAKEISFFYNDLVDKELSPTAGDVIPITISAGRSASGTYLSKVTVYSGDDSCVTTLDPSGCDLPPYDTRSFFIKIS